MPAATLKTMAIEAASRNLSGIVDVADISYDLIQPLLARIRNADQLLEIERNSPHIAEHDMELWKGFIRREIPDWRGKIIEPKNPRSWGKVYRKLRRDDDKAKAEQERKLHEALQGSLQTKAANSTQYIDRVIPTKAKERAYIDGRRNPNAQSWNGTRAPPALKNAKTGKDILSAIRKRTAQEAREKGLTGSTSFKVYLPSSRSQIKEAPKSMVKDVQYAQQAKQLGPSAPTVNRFAHHSPPKASNVFAKTTKAPTREQRILDQAIKEKQDREASERSAKATAGSKITSSPPPPPSYHVPQTNAQPVKRKATSIFMPQKKRKT